MKKWIVNLIGLLILVAAIVGLYLLCGSISGPALRKQVMLAVWALSVFGAFVYGFEVCRRMCHRSNVGVCLGDMCDSKPEPQPAEPEEPSEQPAS